MNNIDRTIVNKINKKIYENKDYFDFVGVDTKDYTHRYHSYPAMMIPMIPRSLLDMTLEEVNISNLYDPFCGSGTTAVEGVLRGLEVFTNDINPLSTFMAKVKTTPIEPDSLKLAFEKLSYELGELELSYNAGNYTIENLPTFKNIDYWFKEEVIIKLQMIKESILKIENIAIKEFFLAAFSDTVRYVSNSRNSEFKLYRLEEEKLKKWNPNVFNEFKEFSKRNIDGNRAFYKEIGKRENRKHIYNLSSMNLSDRIPANSFDLLITSPPYGDSKTTVAYGQFSRLSLQWLNLEMEMEVNQLDNVMLGGKVDKELNVEETLNSLQSQTLIEIYNDINENDTNEKKKRGLEVLQFFKDIDKTLSEIARVMKNGSYQYWVVANRKVKNVDIPLDQIIVELFSKYKIIFIERFYRNIPNKKMPKTNSPTNKKGKKVSTMNKEIILMFRKEENN
ncbi:DNA adenine methylase [Clostridium perfringens]|uniref:DNA adenine methylase n=1 Tax=Clostridium perfringens TaxID=1502 RepID=UPI0024BC3CBC|nr:DNA adenine methylase [Clostridium perfringens]ELC8333036.1 DNA adenine methylase [Clostridium perfringens]ELC8464132.1 DNA adenine methylase [Clostridium perfringens]MDK0553963.1 DNA adenine methylase [Clostridium perfringens]WVM62368.1 DNA adenine methylase [Clostridium perfringens]